MLSHRVGSPLNHLDYFSENLRPILGVVMAKNLKHLYEFGPFRLDAGERLLLREGEAVPLTPKAFDLLLVLVAHCGHLMEKEELMKAVWPDSIVEENNLADNIFKLRKALGEGRHGQRFIETVPKRGYRFVAPMREEAVEPGIAADAQSPVTITPQAEPVAAAMQLPTTVLNQKPAWDLSRFGRRRPGLAVLLAVLLLIGATGVISLSRMKHQPTVPNAAIKSIAVLPFKSLNRTQDDEYLGFGIADSVITKLSGTGKLIVRPTGAVSKYTALTIDPLAAGREQQVDAVLDASLWRSGEKLRVTVRLLRVRDEWPIWVYESEKLHRPLRRADLDLRASG
jgi:DNA-binding winged helix-turn-helix (wHTH) protein/TolB-like protein